MDPALFDLNARIEQDQWWFAGRRRIMQELLGEVVPPGQDALVIDVGCGTGANLASLHPAYRTVGIDPTPAAVERARERFPDVEFVCGMAPDDLGDAMGEADAVLVMDVLEHVEDDRGLLASLVEPLSVGAHVLITVPADIRLWSEHDVSHGHYRRYDVAGLRSVWGDLPVTEVMLSPFNARLYPVARVVRWVSRRRGKPAGESGSDLSLPPRPANAVLRAVFGGEASQLVRVLERRGRPYRRGVSLVSVLRREA